MVSYSFAIERNYNLCALPIYWIIDTQEVRRQSAALRRRGPPKIQEGIEIQEFSAEMVSTKVVCTGVVWEEPRLGGRPANNPLSNHYEPRDGDHSELFSRSRMLLSFLSRGKHSGRTFVILAMFLFTAIFILSYIAILCDGLVIRKWKGGFGSTSSPSSG